MSGPGVIFGRRLTTTYKNDMSATENQIEIGSNVRTFICKTPGKVISLSTQNGKMFYDVQFPRTRHWMAEDEITLDERAQPARNITTEEAQSLADAAMEEAANQ